jgi:hypothetical protein
MIEITKPMYLPSYCYNQYVPFALQVMKHLTKLFDSMAKLKFEMDAATNQPKKIAVGMFSKDGEYVNMDKPCDLNGQVGVSDTLLAVLYVTLLEF